MAETIKGINVVIGAETTGLNKALADVNKQSRDIASELKQVERGLKFNPKDTVLLAQKQKLLGDQVSAAREKLDRLRTAQEQVNEQFKKGDISEGQYRAFQREVVEAESKLKHFETQLKSTQDRSKEFADRMGEVSKKLEDLSKKFAPISAIGGAVGGALVGLAVKAGKLSDDLHTLSDTTGLSMETLQKFRYASDLIDVSVETLSGSLARLTRNMGNAQRGNVQTQEAFARLGVSITDVNGNLRDNEEVFNEVIKALGQIEEETERDAVAMQLFGRSAQQLNPLIKGGADRLKELGDEAKAAGLIMSDEALDGILEFNDGIDKLKAIFSATGTQLGITVGKVILPMFEKLGEKLEKVLEWVRNLDERIIKITLVIAGIVAVITPLLLLFAKLIAAIQVLVPVFAALNAVMAANPFAVVVVAIGALVAAGVALYKNWDVVKENLLNIWDAIVYGIQQAISYLKTMIFTFAKNALDAINVVAKYIPGLNNAIGSAQAKLEEMIGAEKEIIAYRREERAAIKDAAAALKEEEKATKDTTEAKKEQAEATKELTEAEKKAIEERKKYQEQWSKKLFEETASRIEILEAEMKAELETAEKLGADKTAVTAYYEKKISEVRAEEARKRADEAARIIEEEQKKADEVLKRIQKRLDDRLAYEDQWNRKLFDQNEQHRIARAESVEEEIALKLAQLDRLKQEELARADELGAERQAILDYYALEERKLLDQRDEAYRLSAERSAEAFISFVDVIGSGAKTVAQAIKESIISVISNLQKKILAEAMAAEAVAWALSLETFGASLAHLATVTSKVLPAVGILEGLKAGVRGLAEGGKVVAPTMAIIGEGKHDEAVLPLSQKVFAEIGKGIAANLPIGSEERPIELHFHIGALIGDERGYRKLARKVFTYQIAEQRRLGEV